MESVRVNLGERSYLILIKKGIIDEAGESIFSCNLSRNVTVITNTTVRPLYLSPLLKSLENALFRINVIEIPDGEQYKTLSWVEKIYKRLVAFNLDRNSPIIALGGGVIGDMAGFAAATFMRGLPLIKFPTTLLAQVDSSVGGKTGVNLAEGKNMVGAFYQPRLVLIDPSALATLDHRDLRAGLAEIIKYGIIHDAQFFSYLENNIENALLLDTSVLTFIIKTCCSIKADIVSQDEREGGVRSILNFGHTFGHAVETLTQYDKYRHGEAVAIGIAAAARLSAAWGYCTRQESNRVLNLLQQAGMTIQPPIFPWTEYLGVMKKDKKRIGGNIRMVLMKSIGNVFIEEVPTEKLLASLEEIYDNNKLS